MWSETSNYTLGRSDPDTMTEQWAEPSQTCQCGLSWVDKCLLDLDFIWDDEDETDVSHLCTTYDPIPDEGMDWQFEDGLQDTIMWEVTTDCDFAAETMVSTDIEMLDYSEDPAYIYHQSVEEPEEMDWEPCYSTDADNDIIMRDA
ncbi:hypothetical protein MY11210_007354 [Beauveria gryllotalpidicola]